MRLSDGTRFTFIAGAAGSGTTVLLRLLSAPETSASLGGNHLKIPGDDDDYRLVAEFRSANDLVWDRSRSIAENQEGWRRWRAAWEKIQAAPAFAGISHYFFKRSFPFGYPHGQFVPYLWDVADMVGDVHFVLIYRDPRASTYSALHRGFGDDLRRLAVVCSEQLTLLAAQARTLPPERLHLVSYRRLCTQPWATVERLLGSLAMDGESIRQAVALEMVEPTNDDRYRRELPAEGVAWLDRFFDERRCRQWALLAAAEAE